MGRKSHCLLNHLIWYNLSPTHCVLLKWGALVKGGDKSVDL